MKILEDVAQKTQKHKQKQDWLQQNGHELIRVPLPVGDYVKVTDRVQNVIDRRGDKLKKMDLLGVTEMTIDTKQDLTEVVNNICGKSHARFRDEAILAQENGIRFVVLVEHSRYIKTLEDVKSWKNPRQFQYERKIRKEWGIPKGADFQTEVAELKKNGAKINRGPTTGEELYKAMQTMAEKYNVIWAFCDKSETGHKIVELLSEEEKEKNNE